MPRLPKSLIVILLSALCIALRIPQLVSGNLLLDGDECVLALMAKHIMAGKDLPFYFYGQQYGFSLIECLFIIPFYWLLGITAVAVKLGMLTLWTTGVLFLYHALRRIDTGSGIYALLLILLFICAPAWAVWSMKARGGYLTAFTASSALLYLLFAKEKKWQHYVAISLLFVLVYESQRIWVPGLLPFIAYMLYQSRKQANYLAFMLPAAALLPFLAIYKQGLSTYGDMPLWLPARQDILPRLQRIPYLLYSSLHGNYYFDEIQKPNLFCALFAIVFALTILALLLIAGYNVITRRKGMGLFNCSALALLLSFGICMFTHSKQARYLLPITGLTVISLTILFAQLKMSFSKVRLYIAGMTVVGLIAVITFYNFQYTTFRHKELTQTLQSLENDGINYVYCGENMFTWQILFYSNERIIAREKRPPGRYPEYQHRVDSAHRHGAKVAYLAYPLYPETITFKDFTFVNGFFVVKDPPAEIIAREFPAAP
jgi:hypothetical protein